MPEQAKWVFYVQDPYDERWSVVLHGKTIGINVEEDDSYIETYVSPLSTQMSPNIVGEEEADDVHANRNDHDEGELINIVNVIFLLCISFNSNHLDNLFSFVIMLLTNVFLFIGKWLHRPALLLLLLLVQHRIRCLP